MVFVAVTLHLAINGRFLTRPPTGVDRFAMELLRAWLPRFGKGNRARVIVPSQTIRGNDGNLEFRPEALGLLRGHAWEQLEIPVYCRNETLLSLCNTGPIMHRSQLVVLHDAGAVANPSAYNFAFRNWYRYMFAGLMRNARVVATVSKFSATELQRHFDRKKRAVEVIYESGEHILRPIADLSILRRLDLIGRKYVLAVGSRTPNKNFGAVVQAAAMLTDMDIKVVAAGGSNDRVFAGVELDTANLLLAGYVSDGQLRALYENAECFVFPSFYEGFGLPPLEAMHCGCPVLASRCAAMPEICGEAAVYFEPHDPKQIATQLRRVLTSELLRAELREAGFARTKMFSWSRSAEQLEQILPK